MNNQNQYDEVDIDTMAEEGTDITENEIYDQPPRETGYVKWFDERKRYGFIRREDGSDVFVHASSINRNPPRLRDHERVEFTVVPGKKGPAAEDVVVLVEPPR